MANNGWHRLNEFRTSHAGIVIFYGYLAAVLIAGVTIGLIVNDLRNLSTQNHRALCNQKQSYERNLKQATTYLARHPNGTREFSKGLIVSAIVQDRFQIRAFNDVACGA